MTRKHLQLSAGNGGRLASVITESRPLSRTTTQDPNVQLIRNGSLARPSKNVSNISKPVAPPRPLESSRAIQVSAKRAANAPSTSLVPQKAYMVASRPCTQEKNTIGPQRVIRPNKNSAATTSIPSVVQTDIKTSLARPAGAPCSRVASSTSLIHSSGSRPAAPSNKKMQTIQKDPENMKLPGDATVEVTASRNLSRPTISQLARVRPPVNKSVHKIIRRLEVCKTKLSAKSELNGPITTRGRSLNNEGRSANIPVGRSKHQQPIVPALIPLPPSPVSSTLTRSPVTNDSTMLEGSKMESQPESTIVGTDRQGSSQTEFGAESSGKQISFHARQL